MSDFVTIFEMGPRDGLQNEKKHISTSDKIKLVDMLSDCGFKKIEVTSFVSPKWVPQMADAAEVLAGIVRRENISYAALTPNLRGYEGARAAKTNEVAIFASASEGFSQKNINCSIAESIERFKPVLEAAKADGMPVRGYVSCVTDCPYDGPTAPEAVVRVATQLLDLGCYEISLGDTIGAAAPETTSLMLEAVLALVPANKLAGHFHDTKGRAIDNIEVCLGYGIRTFDAAVGGLGGCPYAPGAKGNVATEAVVEMLVAKGFTTGIDAGKLSKASSFALSLKGQ
ncbi:hydroxymethylglutaryl-CoA lyase [Maritalea porphyrae]|uniref:hydroxymethylglutaryl-CoA lyase n=1 Tax=Maritalea porphyrae TaxID=880732 RepID=UPI0022B01F0C|nr:hydroxymethylglutaryl-CoA lyase [Maritalea porphyrae]MCZ4272081.1 hydroxymethylglutaryl-CoA lyase [Maritalea porphyrae]